MTCSSCGAVNPAGMRYCGMCGVRLGRPGGTHERRRVTMLFVDLSGFSQLTRDLDPEDLRDLADEVLSTVTSVVEGYDGYVDALKGDGLLALFGAPRSHPDDALRAVLAGSASLNAIEELGRARGLPLVGRAGVNTGSVIAGPIGSGRVRSYTVMGSAVNLASRLEDAAAPGQVWVGPETYRATRNRLHYRPTGTISIDGFPDVTSAHILVAPVRRQVDPYAHVGFVGREGELATLRALYEQAAETSSPREVWVVAEAGRGKTRLLREFVRSVACEKSLWWLEPPAGDALGPSSIGRQIFGVTPGEDDGVARAIVQRKLDELLPGQSRWHRLILASLELAPPVTWPRTERRRIDRTNLAWRDLIVAVVREANAGSPSPKPLVVVVESEHRTPVLRELTDLLLQESVPLFLIHTARRLNAADGRTIIQLPALSGDESAQLLSEVTGSPMRDTVATLLEQVGGVPAYVLELGRALTVATEDSFSGSVASLLQARLDMVAPRHRRLLAYAALAGELVWEGLLRELGGPSAAADVGALIRQNMLVVQVGSSVPGEIEYRFQSELLRNGVLRMVPFADRPVLHLRIATWLEQHAPLGFSAVTAAHFAEGGAPEAAYAHYLAAAALAEANEDDTAAFDLFDKLLALSLTPAQVTEGNLALGQAALNFGDDARARAALDHADAALAACSPDERASLQLVLEQLRSDLVPA